MPKPIKTIKQRDEEGTLTVAKDGLKLSWKRFADEYVKNGGNGTRAYMVAYPDVKDENVAGAAAPRILKKASIQKEIENIMAAQTVTEEWIIKMAQDYAEKGLIYKEWAAAGAKSTEMLGKVRGMLVDTKKFTFDGDNPALFPALVKVENAKKFEEEAKKGERISE